MPFSKGKGGAGAINKIRFWLEVLVLIFRKERRARFAGITSPTRCDFMFVIDQRVSSLGAALLAPLVRAQRCAYRGYGFVPVRLGQYDHFLLPFAFSIFLGCCSLGRAGLSLTCLHKGLQLQADIPVLVGGDQC